MRRPSFEPESENPLTSGLHFLVVILYAFVVQELLHAVFTNWMRVEPWLVLLVAAVLVELLHYATEDYIYTEALEDPLDPATLHVDVLQYLLHFLGVLALIAATYAIIVPLSATPAESTLGTGTAAIVLVCLAVQHLTFALWQVLNSTSSESGVTNPSGTTEAERWRWVFLGYSVVLATTAIGIGLPHGLSPIPNSSGIAVAARAMSLLVLGWLAVLSFRSSWRNAYTLPASHSRMLSWVLLFGAGAMVLVVANAWLLIGGRLNPLAATVITVGTLLALKAHYLYEWAGFYHRLLGTSPEIDWSKYRPG